MDLGELPEWMAWERNHHWFALRTWGGITWRWLVQAAAASVLELIALGSCGAGAGKGLVEKMLATIGETCNGKVFVVLKSLAGAEDFWSQQGFSTLSDSPEAPVGKIRRTLDQYCTNARPLKPFVLTLDYGSTSASSASSSSMV